MSRIHGSLLLCLSLAACALPVSDAERRARAEKMFREGFSRGDPVLVKRVESQDEVQAACSTMGEIPKDVAARIEKSQQATLRYPADGKLMGDWREGEKIAQDGWGMRFTDTGQPKRLNGGACYNCHQLTTQELSFGTLGPSLHRFGKQRGFTPEMQKYAYAKIYNSQAFTACSNMPRFGHQQILTEKQIRDVVALLMDPESPVNK
jgi:L-cysteine S-thiosulfotransferase